MSSLLRDLERVQPEETPNDELDKTGEVVEAFQDALKKLNEKIEGLTSQVAELTKEPKEPTEPTEPKEPTEPTEEEE